MQIPAFAENTCGISAAGDKICKACILFNRMAGPGYPNLEFVIIDGGSTDGSLQTIDTYAPWLTSWVSEPDRGQSHAINKGFMRANGIYGNWINSDDLLAEGALNKLAQFIDTNSDKKVFLGEYQEYSETENKSVRKHSDIQSLEELININGGWRKNGGNQIGQQATFFPLSLLRKVGMLNQDNHFSMDYELWGRFLISGAEFIRIPEVLGIFRIHKDQKISNRVQMNRSLIYSANMLIRENTEWSWEEKSKYIKNLKKEKLSFQYHHFRSVIGIKRRSKALINALLYPFQKAK